MSKPSTFGGYGYRAHAQSTRPGRWLLMGNLAAVLVCPLLATSRRIARYSTAINSRRVRLLDASWARSSSDCGIVRPSDFTVLRLMTNSNFVGRSAGSDRPNNEPLRPAIAWQGRFQRVTLTRLSRRMRLGNEPGHDLAEFPSACGINRRRTGSLEPELFASCKANKTGAEAPAKVSLGAVDREAIRRSTATAICCAARQ